MLCTSREREREIVYGPHVHGCWARSSPALSFSFVRFSLAVKLFAGDDLSNWHGRHLLWPGSRGKRPDPGAQRTVCSSAAPPSRLRDRTACGAVQVLGFCRLLRSPLRHAATARSLAIPACLELGLTTLLYPDQTPSEFLDAATQAVAQDACLSHTNRQGKLNL